MALILLWAVGIMAVVGLAVWSVMQARRARLERRPEAANLTDAR
jgi:threonine/homoserine/homoserine lactone efflux protein